MQTATITIDKRRYHLQGWSWGVTVSGNGVIANVDGINLQSPDLRERVSAAIAADRVRSRKAAAAVMARVEAGAV
jgi:hypothetical protein